MRVLGTRFSVERNGEHVHVSVTRGKVRVESAQLEGSGRDSVAGEEVDVAEHAVKDSPSAMPTAPATGTTNDIDGSISEIITNARSFRRHHRSACH